MAAWSSSRNPVDTVCRGSWGFRRWGLISDTTAKERAPLIAAVHLASLSASSCVIWFRGWHSSTRITLAPMFAFRTSWIAEITASVIVGGDAVEVHRDQAALF